MMQVQCPQGVAPGQMIQIQTPSGPMNVPVPAGVAPGGMFVVQVPSAAPQVVQGQAVQAVAPQQGYPQQQGYPTPTGGVAMAQYQPGMATAAPGQMAPMSQDFLTTMDGLFIRQQLELLELISGCETKNKYNVVPIPTGTPIPPPGAFSSNFTSQMRSQSSTMPLFKAKEDSECFERICCPLFRGLRMPFVDGAGQTFLTLERPCICDPCYAPPHYACCGQEMTTKNASGQALSKVKMQPGCCTAGCCAGWYNITDSQGSPMYKLRVSTCNTHAGACGNCCAPSCCNESFDIDVYDGEGKYVNTSAFVWPGCNCGGLTDLSNMAIVFPPGSSAEQRASLLGGFMLIEFTAMEFARQQNNDNNNGCSGGAPPAGPAVMER